MWWDSDGITDLLSPVVGPEWNSRACAYDFASGSTITNKSDEASKVATYKTGMNAQNTQSGMPREFLQVRIKETGFMAADAA